MHSISGNSHQYNICIFLCIFSFAIRIPKLRVKRNDEGVNKYQQSNCEFKGKPWRTKWLDLLLSSVDSLQLKSLRTYLYLFSAVIRKI